MPVYPLVFQAVLSRMDPELAHRLTLGALRLGHGLPGGPALIRAVFSTPHPVRGSGAAHGALDGDQHRRLGLAAGLDKNGAVPLALLDLGFGHVEIGTITARPQPGNPSPRLFRLLADRALINRMGFNNDGAVAVARRLARVRSTERGQRAVIGVNIGKTKTTPLDEAADDYRFSARTLAPYASYLSVNVSSPNTPGLRDLQSADSLRPVLQAVLEEARECGDRLGREVPVLVKIAPDLHDQDALAIADLVTELGLAGIIATNTTIFRPTSLHTSRARLDQIGAGGLSGPVLAERSEQMLTLLRARLGQRATLVSCGGITTAQDARRRIAAGADLIQGYTAFIYEGPAWPGRIARGIARH